MKNKYQLLLFCFAISLSIIVSCKKKNETPINNKVALTSSIDCRDCYWSVVVGPNTLKQEARGDHKTNFNFEVNKGDTVMMVGWSYDVNAAMVGTLLQGTAELKKGYAHCNQNPSFFLFHVIPK